MPGEPDAGRSVLVVGGGGAFGRHLVRGLLLSTGFRVVIGGRDAEKAEAFAMELRRDFPPARIEIAAVDRATLDIRTLSSLGVFAVADAAGPFQQGGYSLPRACIEARVQYIDIADARDFVAGFSSLDAAAKRAGVTLVTGASSTPALSNAALDRLTAGWRSVESIEIGISPGNRAPRGRSVMSAILSYVGRPVRVFVGGRWQTRPGWGLLTRRTFPGLRPRWLSLCETPDLELVPMRFAPKRHAIFRAGLELSVLHLGLVAASLPVRLGLIRSLRPFARSFAAIADLFSGFGSDRGGMMVEAVGEDAEGQLVMARWSLVAEGGDGPVIPTLPALALLRTMERAPLPIGASACVGLLTLEEIEAEFLRYRITTRLEAPARCLFARALPGFDQMPAAIRAAHAVHGRLTLRGEARVDGPEGAVAGIFATLFLLPKASPRIPVTVTMQRLGNEETWTRDFGGKRFTSVLAGRGGLTERFGIFTFDLDVPTSERGLTMAVRGWRMGPLRLPGRLAPFTDAREDIDEDGHFRFDVTIGLPFAGRLVRYRGWLMPEMPKDP